MYNKNTLELSYNCWSNMSTVVKQVLVKARCRVQYGKYFPSFPSFEIYSTSLKGVKYEKGRKYLIII